MKFEIYDYDNWTPDISDPQKVSYEQRQGEIQIALGKYDLFDVIEQAVKLQIDDRVVQCSPLSVAQRVLHNLRQNGYKHTKIWKKKT
jgi:hypothetical protein